MDCELEAFERAALAGPTQFTPSVVQLVSNASSARPISTSTYTSSNFNMDAASTSNKSSNVSTVKASELKSAGRRRGSNFKPEEGKIPMSAYMNPNMTPEQQAMLNAMLQRSGRGIDNSSRAISPFNLGTSGGSATSVDPAMQTAKSLTGADLLVGFIGSDEYTEEEEEDYHAPVTEKVGSAPVVESHPAPPPPPQPTMRLVSSATALNPMAGAVTNLQESTKEILANAARFDSDFECSSDDREIQYRPTVDPMSKGGEAKNIIKRQDEMYDFQMPAHRPYLGGFSAAAYEASREYHYREKAHAAAEALVAKNEIKDRHPPRSI